jgi:hypothetical protein
MVGYEDLDEYGTWRVVPAYGTVWAPRSVPAGWAPYRFGHWAWVEPWGWTWIDDAPWGFAPFHYGRWALVAGGWVWIPGTVVARPVYAPALVVFLGAPGSGAAGVGWFPLGPREVYVPPYRVSTTYVRTVNRGFVVNVNVETIDVTRAVYANRRVSGAVTYVPRQTFVGAQPVARSIIRAPQADVLRAPVTGTSPFLVPQRESGLPSR